MLQVSRVPPRHASLLVLALMAGCSTPEEPKQIPVRASATAPNASASSLPARAEASALPPLHAPSPTLSLALDGLGPATVEVPVGATEPRPIVVAVHGHSVRPEHTCKQWRQASGGRAFVLCPHGLPADAKPDQVVTLGNEAYTLREIDAGLAALQARFGDHVDTSRTAYAGYSLGARRGVGIVRDHPGRFRRAAFGEGGYQDLSRPVLQAFARGGVQRVLLVCSSRACELTFGRVKDDCDAVGLACRVVPSGENPHLFAGKVVDATRSQWPWLVEGYWEPNGGSAQPP